MFSIDQSIGDLVEVAAKKAAVEVVNKTGELLSDGWGWVKKKINKGESPEVK